MTKEEILKSVRENDLKMVRFLYIDNDGIVRGYQANRKALENDLDSGHYIAAAMPFFTAFDDVIPNEKYGGPIGEYVIVPDLNSFKVLPYARANGAVICDIRDIDRNPVSICARTKLKEILNKLDYEVCACFENEFYFVIKKEDGTVIPFDDSMCFTTKGMNTANEIILEIVDALEQQGMEVEKYYPEYGPGQQELVIKYRPALEAADNQIYFRETVRAIALKHGIIASFMPKPFANKSGCGCHINLSCWKDGKNLFFNNVDNHLSRFGYYFAGGILKHINSICAFTNPTITSYKRIIPHNWASAFAAIGFNNKEVALRIPTTQYGHGEKTARIEYKPADCAAQPYLALAALIVAGNEGVKQQIDGKKLALEKDPANLTEEQRDHLGIYRLPKTLEEAINSLEQDELFREFFGDEMIDAYIQMKRQAWEEYMLHVTQWEVDKYLDIF